MRYGGHQTFHTFPLNIPISCPTLFILINVGSHPFFIS